MLPNNARGMLFDCLEEGEGNAPWLLTGLMTWRSVPHCCRRMLPCSLFHGRINDRDVSVACSIPWGQHRIVLSIVERGELP